jgi:hypothetical protein
MKVNRSLFTNRVKQKGILPRHSTSATVSLLTLVMLVICALPSRLQADVDRQQVAVLVIGYDREMCNEYGENCRDSELSRAFEATGDTLEDSLVIPGVYRIDVKKLQLKWLDTDRKARETRSQALLRTLGEVSAAIVKDNGQVSALIFVGHGLGAGYIGPTFEGEPLNVMELARQVELADQGAIIALACSVAIRMDLSGARAHGYRVFATQEYIDWLDNGKVKLSSQYKSMYKPANKFSLPEQTQHYELSNMDRLRTTQISLTIQEVLLQAMRRTTGAPVK